MKASDLLLAACDVIEWQGWYKGHAQKQVLGIYVKGGPVCMIGALVCSSTGNDTVTAGTLSNSYYQALNYLGNYVNQWAGMNISGYNDKAAETKDDVINVLIGAAQLAYDNDD